MSSADVVIAGYGPAGASAAIAAHDAGARVIIVESARRGGGNARYSGGFLCDLPADRAVDHLDALCFGRTDRRVLAVYAAGLHDLDGWLGSLGGTTVPFEPPPVRLPAPFPSWRTSRPAGISGTSRSRRSGPPRRGPVGLSSTPPYRPGASRCSIRVPAPRRAGDRPGRRGHRLVRHQRRPGRVATLTARGGVVLACGGFEADPALADAYLPLGPSWPVGHPGNTGAGLRMAQQAGAALWHMYGCFGWFAFRRRRVRVTVRRSTSSAPATSSPTPTAAGSPTRPATRCTTGSAPCCPTCPATPTGRACPAGRCSTRRPGWLAR